MKLSIVIPAHNEEGCVESTVSALHQKLLEVKIEHEILVINDHSKDKTESILRRMSSEMDEVRYLNNEYSGGFGFAIRYGLDHFTGEVVAIYMADNSDDPNDLVKFYREIEKGYDCAFGSRFSKGGKTTDYPGMKLFVNRLANLFIKMIFQLKYNDTTNAFKMYRRSVIDGLRPFLSHHFNLTVELPLKAIIRGYSYSIVPNSWKNRSVGESKLKIKEMGSRYLFIVIYCFIEKWLSRGDYHSRNEQESETKPFVDRPA
jgi:dolichol-phosphate mannosyltransferase